MLHDVLEANHCSPVVTDEGELFAAQVTNQLTDIFHQIVDCVVVQARRLVRLPIAPLIKCDAPEN